MSFLDKLSRALGFGGEQPDDDYEYVPTIKADEPEDDGDAAQEKLDKEVARMLEPEPEPDFDPAVRDRIFDGVLAVFNAALPDFIQRSLDPEAQRKALSDSLDASVREYMASLRSDAERYAESRLRHETNAARAEAERLRKEMESLSHQKANIQEQQLSADRRKRALANKVTDLEQQLEKVEAEREQFELENKSLLNRIKLSEVQPGIIEDLQKEIERLKAAGAPVPAAAPTQDSEGAVAEAVEAAKAEYAARIEALEKEIEETRGKLDSAVAELEAARGHASDLEGAQEMSKQIYTQLQEELTGERSARKELQDALDETRAGLDAARKELSERKSIEEEIEAMNEQLSKVQEVVARRDERIARLKAANKDLKEQLAKANAQKESREAATPGLFGIANADELAGADDDFECPDWFVSEPGPNTPQLKSSVTDFGYTEPPRKPLPPENDSQLSLF